MGIEMAFIFRRAAQMMQRATQTQIRRGSGGPKPQYEGAEKKFREIFVEDYQVVPFVLGLYVVPAVYFSLGGSEEAVKAAPVPSAAPKGDVLSVADEGFGEWIKDPANLKIWEESLA